MSVSVLSGVASRSRSREQSKIVNEARSWLGTPFKHQGRVKGVGCDCIGLIAGVANALQLSSRRGGVLNDYDRCDYPREPDGLQLQEMLERHLVKIWLQYTRIAEEEMSPPLISPASRGEMVINSSPRLRGEVGRGADPNPANILLFRIEKQPQHVALMSSETHMIHAYAQARKVVETRLDSYWRERLVGVFRFARHNDVCFPRT